MSRDTDNKTAYICGPLTELSKLKQKVVKIFYEQIADVYCEITGRRAFVPHEHYDPVKHFNFSPTEVDYAERRQVCERTTVLVVVAVAPSWGGGIEVEMAFCNRVPVIILHKKDKKISRLLRGNPAVIEVISFNNEKEALMMLRDSFKKLIGKS